MKTLNQDQIIERVQNFLNELSTDHTDISYYVNPEDITDYNDAFEQIEEKIWDEGLNVEIIYYASAIKYLQENDNSLQQSLGIANELGFTLENLNSETLASLLATQNNQEQFYELRDEIDTFFNELQKEIDEKQ